MFAREFDLFLQEGHLARSCLLSGFGFLNRADYMERKGSYYSAFFQLSIGIERLIKIAYMLNHKLENNMSLPDESSLTKLGHNLLRGYDICSGFNGAPEGFAKPDSIEYDILSALSDFGRGSRYHNLNELLGKARHVDPIKAWHDLHLRIANEDLSYKKQEALNKRAIDYCDRMGRFHYARNVNGEYVPYVDILAGFYTMEAATPYCVWHVLALLSPFYKLLYTLCSKLHLEENGDSVPYMYEFFVFLLCNKRTVLQRKSWVSLYD
jgi:hypothetical protein